MASWDEKTKRTLGGESNGRRARMVIGVGGSGGLDAGVCERVRGLRGREGSAIGGRVEGVDKGEVDGGRENEEVVKWK
jgi:hypothetical protein